jgi:hypothetical protein
VSVSAIAYSYVACQAFDRKNDFDRGVSNKVCREEIFPTLHGFSVKSLLQPSVTSHIGHLIGRLNFIGGFQRYAG